MSRVALLLLLAINFAFANFATKSALGFILQGLYREHNLTKKLNMINSAIKLAKYEDNNTILLMNLYDAKSVVATALDDKNLTISSIDKTIELSKKVSNDLYYNYLLAKANYLIYFKDYSSAKKINDEILKNYSNKNSKIYYLALKNQLEIYLNLKKFKDALELADKLIQKYKFIKYFPKDELYDLFSIKLRILTYGLKDYNRALTVLNDIKEHFKDEKYLHDIEFKEAIVNARAGNIDKAIKIYKKLLKNKDLDDYIRNGSVLNLLELLIIANKKITDSEFKRYGSKIDKDSFEEFEMLKILYNAKESSQDEKINEFKKQFQKKHLDWSFNLLDRWVNSIKEKEIKDREKRYIEFFKSYNN